MDGLEERVLDLVRLQRELVLMENAVERVREAEREYTTHQGDDEQVRTLSSRVVSQSIRGCLPSVGISSTTGRDVSSNSGISPGG